MPQNAAIRKTIHNTTARKPRWPEGSKTIPFTWGAEEEFYCQYETHRSKWP